MITAVKSDLNYPNVYDLRGLHDDTKPTFNIGNGSTFYEIDTGALYLYDEENETWIAQ